MGKVTLEHLRQYELKVGIIKGAFIQGGILVDVIMDNLKDAIIKGILKEGDKLNLKEEEDNLKEVDKLNLKEEGNLTEGNLKDVGIMQVGITRVIKLVDKEHSKVDTLEVEHHINLIKEVIIDILKEEDTVTSAIKRKNNNRRYLF